MRTKLLKFTAVLGLMLASSNAFASFIYVDANGYGGNAGTKIDTSPMVR